MSEERAAIVQGDRSVLLEVDHPGAEAAREILARCAEIEKSPEHVHTYRLSDLALWNAAASGCTSEEVLRDLASISRFDIPGNVAHEIADRMGRHGVCALVDHDETRLRLVVTDALVRERVLADKRTAPLIERSGGELLLSIADRGRIKQLVLGMGWPIDDRAGLSSGAPLDVELRAEVFSPYPFQTASVDAFIASRSHGVVVLPCGAGKTVVGLAAMSRIKTNTLIITSGREAASQWVREAIAKTTIDPAAIASYDAARKDVRPVTVTTYSMLGKKGGGGPTGFLHFDRLAKEPWGLLIYDEVHLLPAPVFRLTADLQARRRLGLTATLIREDGREGDVFALIGPKRYDVPWRELEASGHIAAATCFEARVPLADSLRMAYATAPPRDQPRVAAENPEKLPLLAKIAERHEGDRVLVIGSYLDSLKAAARLLSAPVITGETPSHEREKLYAAFRSGAIRRLVLSRVGNFAIDLPEANVLIQLSGTMGSRQEEAQRLGRILRPKIGGATFYTLVTRDTVEQENALHRQLFLTEQGYRYFIEDVEHVGPGDGVTIH